MIDSTYMTSKSAPLRIAEIATPNNGGLIGVTFAPGKKQVSALSGPWHRDLSADLDIIAAWGAAAVISLVEDHELDALQIREIGREVIRRHMEWHHLPIQDVSVPSQVFEASWSQHSECIRTLLANKANVLIHCKGGLGRAGMIAARLLVEMGNDPDAAIAQVRAARPGAVETAAQEAWVAGGRVNHWQPISRSADSLRDRAVGALLGLAVGDAVGTTLEFSEKPTYAKLNDMVGGGPFGLEAGQWTDDTAMALALSDSLIAFPDLDAEDLMKRFVAWHDEGVYSCTGECFDIGITTSSALRRFQETGSRLAGSTSPQTAGNGALMRLAPVAIRHLGNPEMLVRVAKTQTMTTHGAPEAIEASIFFAQVLADAIHGAHPCEVFASRASDYSAKVHAIARGEYRGRHRTAIRGTGYVIQSLEAAMWAVSRTTSFRSAILLAANLGEDADTTAAIAGQIAGAIYGASGIPTEWLGRLAWRDIIQTKAQTMFDASGV